MEYLFAPMEGITLSRYRQLHHRMFPGTAEYYPPFIAPDSKGSFRAKYLKDLLADREEVRVIPQLLVNNADSFNLTAKTLWELGFDVINLNAGCPSGTVFSKHKGAGMLQDLGALDHILDQIFTCAEQTGYRISIKTRMGIHSTEEFSEIFAIYRQYPVEKLIVHARSRDGLYRSIPDLQGFRDVLRDCTIPLCYNGDITSPEKMNILRKTAPRTESVMIGRGVVANPALIRFLQGGEQLRKEELQMFLQGLTQIWLEDGLSPAYTVERMKNLWAYMEGLFSDSRKEKKAIMKAKKLEDYLEAVSALFERGTFAPDEVNPA